MREKRWIECIVKVQSPKSKTTKAFLIFGIEWHLVHTYIVLLLYTKNMITSFIM